MLFDIVAGVKRNSLAIALALMILIGFALILLPTPSSAAGDPVIVAAGDIACDPTRPSYNGGQGTATNCHEIATSNLVLNLHPTAVLALGDTQYMSGTLSQYAQSYNPTWGRFKGITFPAPGNHEYNTPGAAGYYSYFGAVAGKSSQGWYSFDIGTWHLIALNSECHYVGTCNVGSPQETWLKADLVAHRNLCTLAYWHEPRFSSGKIGNRPQTAALWNDLYAAHVDVVLGGHDHDYERFAPQTPLQKADPANGIREFVVGTGGEDHGGIGSGFKIIQPNSQVRNDNTFGVLMLTLHPTSYNWQFVPEPGGRFTDAGATNCH